MKNRLVLAFLIALLLLTACQAPAPTPLEGTEREQVLAYSEPAADNMFAGINANDYAVFSQDFDTKMAAAMNEKAFSDLQGQIISKVGKYVSREISGVEASSKYITVIYKAAFELQDPVTVRLVFNTEEENKISGLWFE